MSGIKEIIVEENCCPSKKSRIRVLKQTTGATVPTYKESPNYPHPDRKRSKVKRVVTVTHTAPTVIRFFKKIVMNR